MTPQQIDRIRASFAQILYRREEAGRMFYERLFTIAPRVRPMFAGDIDAQGRKLVDTLAVAIGALRDTDALTRTLEDLGKRHRGYGVTPDHYQPVGDALMWTLDAILGPAFDAQTRKAWSELYDAVSKTMLSGERRNATVA